MDGDALHELASRLFPLNRSLTGDGVRETLRLVSECAPLELTEVPSGTRVFDWVVPPEWNVRSAWVETADGERIVDVAASSLHLVGYSEPVSARVSGRELRDRLHSLPDQPERIPYVTSYYRRTWGFCVPETLRASIADDAEYDVHIDASLDDSGSLTYGEHLVPGRVGDREILVSTYVCHPSLANDNVAGIAVSAGLLASLPPRALRSDVRFVFAPSGIGTLAWLERNQAGLDRICGGLVVACAGDPGPLTYKQSRRGDAAVDRAAAEVLSTRDGATVRPFVPWGTDERQFCSPGFDLPVGVLTRTPNGVYPEYHTSADDLDLITPGALADSLSALHEIIEVLDANVRFVRTDPHGEPQLSRHNLEGAMSRGLLAGGQEGEKQLLFWLLNLADGRNDLFDVSRRAEQPFAATAGLAAELEEAGLIRAAATAKGGG